MLAATAVPEGTEEPKFERQRVYSQDSWMYDRQPTTSFSQRFEEAQVERTAEKQHHTDQEIAVKEEAQSNDDDDDGRAAHWTEAKKEESSSSSPSSTTSSGSQNSNDVSNDDGEGSINSDDSNAGRRHIAEQYERLDSYIRAQLSPLPERARTASELDWME